MRCGECVGCEELVEYVRCECVWLGGCVGGDGVSG